MAQPRGGPRDRGLTLSSVPVTSTEPANLPRAAGQRWDDRLGDMHTMTFARLLKGQPPLDDVMRLLVALLCWPVGAQGAMIVRFVAGQFEILASYVDGVLDPGDLQDQPLPSDVVEIVTEAAGRQPVVWTDPEDASRRPLAAWSLGPASADSTVLVLFCATPVSARLVSSRVDDVAEILGVYLIGDDASRTRRAALPVSSAGADHGPLTPRQMAILALMAEGCTNPQIAGRVGFSVSTVRMESLRIYRALGVHDRAQAVVAGRALGVLSEK